MSTELCLCFPDPLCVIVSFGDRSSGALFFRDPLTGEDREDLHWYLDVYGAQLLGSHADREAERIASRLPVWGEALFTAVFQKPRARQLFDAFQNTLDGPRVLTISANHAKIFALPWELLRDSAAAGDFLFRTRQPICIRRCLGGSMLPQFDAGRDRAGGDAGEQLRTRRPDGARRRPRFRTRAVGRRRRGVRRHPRRCALSKGRHGNAVASAGSRVSRRTRSSPTLVRLAVHFRLRVPWSLRRSHRCDVALCPPRIKAPPAGSSASRQRDASDHRVFAPHVAPSVMGEKHRARESRRLG